MVLLLNLAIWSKKFRENCEVRKKGGRENRAKRGRKERREEGKENAVFKWLVNIA